MSKIKQRFKSIGKIQASIIKIVIMSSIIVMVVGIPVFAADTSNSYAKNASDWVKAGCSSIAIAFAAAMGLKEFIKRKFMALLGFIVLAGIALVVINDPTKLQSVGTTLYNMVTGG